MDNSNLIINALIKTDPALAEDIDAMTSWAETLLVRGARVAKFRRYERGEHDHAITAQMAKMLRLSTDDSDMSAFALNYCRIVIDKMSSRLRVSEITTDIPEQNKFIIDVKERVDFETIQTTMFRSAIRDGDSYVMIDPVTMMWIAEPAYDGFSGIVTIYEQGNEYPLWACKIWSEAEILSSDSEDASNPLTMHLKVYQPTTISSWQGSVGGMEVMPDPEYPTQVWPLGYVPIVHFANLLDNYTQYGESEIRVVLPLQDVINRTLHSMVMASEMSAFRIAWSIGLELDKSGITPGSVINLTLRDDSGKIITDLTPEQINFLSTCKVGEFAASDISQYTNQVEVLVRQVSQVSQTPIYGITISGALSGDALRQLEIGLISKVRRFQQENTAAIVLLFELTSAMQSTFDSEYGNGPTELEGISVNWSNPELLDATAGILALVTMREKAPGLFSDDFYRQRIGSLLGLTQAQILAEGIAAKEQNTNATNALTGADGTIPKTQTTTKPPKTKPTPKDDEE
jgi:hypothetical protein